MFGEPLQVAVTQDNLLYNLLQVATFLLVAVHGVGSHIGIHLIYVKLAFFGRERILEE